MVLDGFFNRFGKNKEKFKEMESDVKMQKMVETKQMNSNERELNRFMEEERQKEIKEQLERFRDQRKAENRVNVFAKNDDLFAGHKSVLTDDNKGVQMKSGMLSKGVFFN